MRFLAAQLPSPKGNRIGQLRSRLQDLTQDYAPFFAGLPAHRLQSEAILTDLQHLRRTQLAFTPQPAGGEGEAGLDQP